MNKEVQAEMRRELFESRKGAGVMAGVICFMALSFIGALIPGFNDFMKARDWVALVMLFVSCAVGYLYGQWRLIGVQSEIDGYDDEVLKFKHEALKRKTLTGNITSTLFLAVAALIAAYVFLK